jgi:homoserine dehydrogenase
MHQKVFVLGATGQVGTKLIEQILKKDGTQNNANPTDIIGVANSSKMLVSEVPLCSQIVNEREGVKKAVA